MVSLLPPICRDWTMPSERFRLSGYIARICVQGRAPRARAPTLGNLRPALNPPDPGHRNEFHLRREPGRHARARATAGRAGPVRHS